MILLAAAVLIPTLTAPPRPAPAAGGLDKSLVAPDARWVAHFDVEALARSELLRQLRSGDHSVDIDLDEALEEVRREVGIDPLEDVRSVTLYGSSADDEQLVVHALTSARVDEALTALELRGEAQPMDVGGRTLRRMGPEDAGDMYAWVHPQGADRLVVVSNDVDRVLAAARRIEGKGREPSLAASQAGTLAATPRPGSIFFAAVGDALSEMAHGEDDPASRVVEMARGAVLDLGEAQGMVFGVATLQTEDAESARKVGDILRGATALVGLMAGNPDVPPGLTNLVEALSFESSGTAATVRFEYDVRRLLSDLSALEESEEF